MKLRLIMNPASRAGKGRRLWNGWFNCLKSYNVDFESFVTKSIEECSNLAQDTEDSDVVVAVGGDGTVNAVLNGLTRNRNEKLQLGVLYSGTSPDFCAFHGIDITPETAVRSLLERECRKIDLAEIEYTDSEGEKVKAYFACSCNVGLGKEVADTANRIRKYVGDELGTGFALLKAILKGRMYDFKLRTGSEEHVLRNANHLALIKNPLIASGLKLDLDLAPDNRKLGLWVLSGFSRLGMLKMLPGFYNGKAGKTQKGIFSLVTGEVIEVSEPGGLGIEFDGDSYGYLPLTVKISDKQISLRGVL